MADTTPMTPADMSAVLGNRWGYPYGGNSFGFGGGDGGLSAACYYDSMRGTDSDKKY